jgi:hypothetical protein
VAPAGREAKNIDQKISKTKCWRQWSVDCLILFLHCVVLSATINIFSRDIFLFFWHKTPCSALRENFCGSPQTGF